MKKYLYLVMILFFMIIFMQSVSAENFSRESIPDIYYKINFDDKEKIIQAAFIKDSNNNIFYSINPFDELGFNYVKYFNNYDLLGLHQETFEYINALAYYGYNYGSRTKDIDYVITQLLIWKNIFPNAKIVLTSSIDGEEITTYNSKIKSVNRAVERYIPISKEHTIEVNSSRPLFIKYLLDYEEVLTDGLEIDEGGRINLVEKFNNTKTYQIAQGYENSMEFYLSNNYVSLFRAINLPRIINNYNIISLSSRLNINFNNINDYKEDVLFENVYGIYNNNNELIEKIVITDNNYSIDLDYGNYYLKQIECGLNCKEDLNIYEFEINGEELNLSINIENDQLIDETIDNNINSIKTNNLDKEDTIYNPNNEIAKETNIKEIITNKVVKQGEQKELKENKKIEKIKPIVPKYDINIYVSDINGKNIKDSKICLYNSNKELIRCGNTNKYGKVLFKNNNSEVYYLKQENVSNNYKLNKVVEKINLLENKSIYLINYLKENKNKYFKKKESNSLIVPLLNEEKIDDFKINDNQIPVLDTNIEDINTTSFIITVLFMIIVITKYYVKKNN
ncbi:MAG: Cys-Gln thioester bond-forming surface protein [Bacilli bacterium]|nr:Cys-Gln thioester bond-forming surface protein [Bacilli bacterium]